MSNLYEVFQNIGEQFAEFGPVAVTVMAAIGICMVGAGIIMLAMGSKYLGGGSPGKGNPSLWGLAILIGGSLLMSVAYIANITLASTVGGSAALSIIGL